MLINQLSVFLENRPGQLSKFVGLLAENHIDMLALSIAEGQDYGILRLIVDNVDKTTAVLKAAECPFTVTKVLSVAVPDKPGALSDILMLLANHNIGLKYSYAFLSRENGKANIVLRVDDNEATADVLHAAGIEC